MTMPLHSDFGLPRYLHWDEANREVILYVHFGFEQYKCRVSAEALEFHYQPPARDEEKYLVTARYHFDELAERWWRKIQDGCLETDGTVLLQAHDW